MVALVALALMVLGEAPPVGTPLLAPAPIGVEPPPVGTPLLAPVVIEASPAAAAPAASATSASAPAEAVATSASDVRRPWFGATIDGGLPEGLGASAVFLPFRFLRLHFGVVTNTASAGVRGGFTVVPFRFVITPTLTGEAGHLFEGDLTGAAQMFLGRTNLPDGLFSKVSYDFYTAQLGVEIGAPDRFLVYLRGGISRVNASVQGTAQTVKGTQIDPGTLNVGLTIPSAKLGLLLYF